jgi:CubicO group peptidase (beta-lactamase class C family)
MSRKAFVAAGASVIPGLALSSDAQTSQGICRNELAAIGALAADFMTKFDAPGLSIAIAKDDRLVFAEAYGFAEKPTEKLTPQHRLRIASVSKPITSVTIMSLVEQGKLALSKRVFGKGAVLGTGYGTLPYKQYVEEITVEHLLNHTCGGWSNSGPDRDPMFTNPRMDHSELISWTLDNLPIHSVPGTKHAYSNFGYCVLGRIIEKVTGAKYVDYVRDNVLQRCGISAIEIAGNTLADRRPNEAVYYGQGGENPYRMQVARMDAHGGWIATPTDLVRFAVRVDGVAGKADILKPETLRTMTTPSPVSNGYALGWMVNRQNNWWHNGSLPGTISLMVRTSGGLCWAAMTNTRRPGSQIDLDLDRLIWNMVGKVTVWPAVDLFKP